MERSREPDVPTCQQHLCIIGCLAHVHAFLYVSLAIRARVSVPRGVADGGSRIYTASYGHASPDHYNEGTMCSASSVSPSFRGRDVAGRAER